MAAWTAAFFTGLSLFAASAQDASPNLTADISRKIVRVGMFPLTGYHNYKGDFPVDGYGFDYLQRLRGFTPWEYRYSPRDKSWQEMLPMLEAGKIDLLSGVLKTPEREAKFAFAKHPIGETGAILTVKTGNSRFRPGDYKNWNGMRVGLLQDSLWNDSFRLFAQGKKFSFHPVFYSDTEQMLADLRRGKNIDAALSNDFRTLKNEWVYEQLGTSQFFIAVRKSDHELLAELDRAMESLNESQPKFTIELRRRYYYDPAGNQMTFTAEEKAFIRRMRDTHTVFTAIMNPDREPISSFTDGEYRGALKDIADEIVRRTGLKLRFLPIKTRKEYSRAIRQNPKIDLVFDFIHDPRLAEELHFVLSEPYFASSTSLLHRKELIHQFHSIVMVEPSNEPRRTNDFFAPDAQTIKTDTLQNAIDMIASGNADAMFLHTRCAEYAVRTDWRGRLAVQYVPSLSSKYCIAVRDTRNPLLFSILNKAAGSLDETFINSTYFKHNPPVDSPTSLHRMLVRHPAATLGSVFAILAAMTGMLLYALRSRRNARQERSFLYNVTMSIKEGLIVADPFGNVLRMNRIAEEMTGWPVEQATGKPLERIFRIRHNESGTCQTTLLRKDILDFGSADDSGDTFLESRDGRSRILVDYRTDPIPDRRGKTIAKLLSFRDVTEERLRKNEMQREIANWNAVSKIAKIYRFVLNWRTRELSGDVPSDFWPVKNGIAQIAEDWIIPQDAAAWRQCYLDLVSGAKSQLIAAHRILKDGRMRHFREFMQVDPKTHDLITGVIQEVTDIVEIQQKQEAAMLLWQTCIDSVPFMMFVKSARDLRYLQCNGSFARFFGKSPEEIVGKRDDELFQNDELTRHFLASDRAILASGVLQTMHESGLDPSGKRRYIMTVKVPAKGLNGDPVLIGMSVDETEDHQRSIALQNLLENRDAAAELAHVVTYQINYKTWEASGSSLLNDFWPVVNGKASRASDVVLPDDVEKCRQFYMDIVSGKRSETSVDYRRRKADGIHYYRLHMRRDNTTSDTLTGLIQEITGFIRERKKSEALHNLWLAVANAIPAILFVKDADDDYRYLYANNNLGILLKRPVSELIGHTEHEFLSREEAERVRKSDAAVITSGKTIECYELLRDANGVDHHFRSIKIPSFNEFGHRIMIQMTTDVTEVQELSEVRRIVSNAFEKLFFTQDLESGIRGILERVCEFVGFTRGYVCCIDHEADLVRLFTVYIPEGEKSMFNDEKFAITEAASQEWYQKILTSRRGDVFDCDFSNQEDCKKAKVLFPRVYAQKDKFDIRGAHVQYLEINGKPWGYVGFLRQYAAPKVLSENEKTLLSMASNIIELAVTRKRTFVNLQNAMEEAKASAAVKSNFLAAMSHEIRTPLNAVIGFAELLNNPALDGETHQEYLKNISEAGNALLELINDILDISKLSANKMVFTPAETSIPALVSQIGRFFTPKCRAKNLRFLENVPSEMPAVWLDPQRMRQILFNLVGNAVKFTDSGSVAVEAAFTPKTAEAGTLVLRVRDTGIGIPEEDGKRLFQPFSQATAIRGTATANKGTGMGLAICKQMLEYLDGELTFESAPGVGTVFTATLHNVKYKSASGQESEKRALDAGQHERKSFSGISALIVDDVPMNLKLLKSMLKQLGVQAVTATSAAGARTCFSAQDFDCVLTDLWMPDMNGVELAQHLRGVRKEKMPLIGVVTADVEGQEHFDFSVFDAVLTKPLTPQSLQSFLEKAASGHRVRA